MTDTKHTPGPWSVTSYEREDRSGGWTDWDVIAPAEQHHAVGRGVGYGEYSVLESLREEDARLIAAAPDLLAACEAMLKYLETRDEWEAIAVLPARAAIAKARGNG